MSELYDSKLSTDYINNDYYISKSNEKNKLQEIDTETAFENLLLIQEIFLKSGIDFMPAFGTLLGLFRDKKLIPHDIDVDLIIDVSFKDKVKSIMSELEKNGFNLIRNIFNGNLITLERKNEHIDLYFFMRLRRRKNILYVLVGSSYKFDYSYFEKLIDINVKDHSFTVPLRSETLLRFIYGKNWETPIKNKNYNPDSLNGLKKVYSKLPQPIQSIYRGSRLLLRKFKIF
jgi:lipopolysaccharide cholinephosphotransferase